MKDSSLNDILGKEGQDQINQFLYGLRPIEEVADDAKNDNPIEQEAESSKKINKKPPPNIRELSFVRLIDPIHIPSYLVSQIQGRLYDVEKFYQYQKVACLLQTADGPVLNGANMLYAMVHDKLRQVKGFLWMVVDVLTNSLIINNYSVDKEYWNNAQHQAVDFLEEKAKKVMKDLSLSRIVWITKNYRFCENRGFKRSKDAIMIYEGDS